MKSIFTIFAVMFALGSSPAFAEGEASPSQSGSQCNSQNETFNDYQANVGTTQTTKEKPKATSTDVKTQDVE